MFCQSTINGNTLKDGEPGICSTHRRACAQAKCSWSMPTMLDLPLCLRATHMLNILFHSLLARNGLEILSARLTLHWHDDCAPGSEWLRFTKKQVPKVKLWAGSDEEEPFSSWAHFPAINSSALDAIGISLAWLSG